MWDFIPLKIKQSANLEDFKNKIRSWSPTECPCRLCQTYLPGIGYTNIV